MSGEAGGAKSILFVFAEGRNWICLTHSEFISFNYFLDGSGPDSPKTEHLSD